MAGLGGAASGAARAASGAGKAASSGRAASSVSVGAIPGAKQSRLADLKEYWVKIQKAKAESDKAKSEEKLAKAKNKEADAESRGSGSGQQMRSGHRSFSNKEGANSFVIFIFLIFVGAFHLFDYINGFATSFYLRFMVGIFFLIFAFLAFRDSEEIDFADKKRMTTLMIFFVLFAIPPSIVITFAGSFLRGLEKVMTGAFLILPFWFIYILFYIKTSWKAVSMGRVIFVLTVFFMFIGQTGTYASENLNMNVPRVDTVGAADNLKASLKKGIGVFTGIPAQAQAEYQRQQYYATHGYYEGDVADSKQTTQLELTDPSYLNLLEYTGKEKEMQIGTKVNALNIENKMSLYFECSAVPEECDKNNCTPKSIQPSPQMILNEVTVSEDVWCYVKSKDFSPGYNKLTFKATAKGVETKAQLRKFFIDKTTLDSKFVAYVKNEGTKLSTPEDITYVIKKIYPNAKGADLSLSEDAPAKLIISTSQSPVIGIKEGSQIQIILAFENNAKGYISRINSLELTYPEGLEPLSGFCSAFTAAKGKITLAPGQAAQFNLTGIARGEQRSFSACGFNVIDASKLLDTPSNINERSFEAKMTYDYTAEKQYSVKYGEKKTELPSLSSISGGLIGGSSGGLVWPTNTRALSSCYGARSGTFHDGIDIDTINQDPIYSIADGVVQKICAGCVVGDKECCSGYGNNIIIKHHDALYSRYDHLSAINVNQEATVTAGQTIGTSGSTGISSGDHLDFKIYYDNNFGGDVNKDVRNPLCLFPEEKGTVTIESIAKNCGGIDEEFQTNCLSSSVS